MDRNIDVKVFITIDTEEDEWSEYKTTGHGIENIKRIPNLQRILERYGAISTYLVTYPVVNNPYAIKIFKEIIDRGTAEIGAHCHPWNTPPFEDTLEGSQTMICNLPYPLIYKKLKNLHEAIVERLEVKPISFRAGRWGFGPNVAKALHDLGYLIDTSVTPFLNWSEYGGPDFTKAPNNIYRFNTDDTLQRCITGTLHEVPATIGYFQRRYNLCNYIRNFILESRIQKFHLLGLMDKLGIVNLRWLSPEICNGHDMIRLANCIINSGIGYLNLFFHSSSLLPGKSPFVKTQSDLSMFLNDIEEFLKHGTRRGWTFLPLSGALNYWE